MYSGLSLFLNLVSLRIGFGKTVQKASFSIKSKVDFPKTEVLENPQVIKEEGKKGSEMFM